ncbi:zinc finger protein hangover-like [Microplitis mediator]|uniref:zinc finger protein hangover-like n=1 Tax=Microplitis mediator TaxID=375433 RepID=UPI0025536BCE|nr:zinc finger protein hangover-like [Microplitis mediator]
MYKLVIEIDKVIKCRTNGEKTKEINKSSGLGIEKSASVILKSEFPDDKNNLNKKSNFVINKKNKEEDNEDDKKIYEAKEINGKYQKSNIQEDKADDNENDENVYDEEMNKKCEEVNVEEEKKGEEKEDNKNVDEDEDMNEQFTEVNVEEEKGGEEKEDDNKNVDEDEDMNEKFTEINVEEEKGGEEKEDDNKNVDEDKEMNKKYEGVNTKEEIELEEIEEEIIEFIEVYIEDEEVDRKAAEVNIQGEEETTEVSAEIKDDKHEFSVCNPCFVCDLCDSIFDSQESLSLHKKAHINNDKSNELPRFKCHLCNKQFFDEDDVKIHKKEAHPKIKKWRNYKKNVALNNNNHDCEISKIDFHNKSLYDEHTSEHEEKLAADEEMVEAKNKKLIDITNSLPGSDIFKCRICKMPFNSSEKFEEHINYCSSGRKDKWECIICHNLYESHQLLYAHFEDHDTTGPSH